jgi:hypothetical protein
VPVPIKMEGLVDRDSSSVFTNIPEPRLIFLWDVGSRHGSRCPMLCVKDFAHYSCKLRTFEYTTEKLFDGFDTDHKFLSLVFSNCSLLQDGSCMPYASSGPLLQVLFWMTWRNYLLEAL